MKRRATTSQRGYGWRHQQLRKRLAPLVASGRAVCWRCGQVIAPGAPWDLGHDPVDRSAYRGPEHRHCSRFKRGMRRTDSPGLPPGLPSAASTRFLRKW